MIKRKKSVSVLICTIAVLISQVYDVVMILSRKYK